ncbi:MAG: guanylate kinase Gmk [Phormidesmis priestleyi Ana]|uniref:Guanylate kinase n=1 Tax=Phormidesmis priestleyi Ana TaxID=1666911 RepID=A0A0N8KNM6_9CYAN|nr:MAG: guanylate kinase Gmk [Phormidesmis priestleyi Ana]
MIIFPSPQKESAVEAENERANQTRHSLNATSLEVQRSRQTGALIVLAGPSGVGKGTLLNRLLQKHPDIQVSVSVTTRQPRSGEIEGQHYFFVSRDRFKQMVKAGELLEWAEFAGNCYGTPKAPIERAIARGQRVILEIELLGARQVRSSFPEANQIFVMPPSVETLEARIRSRGQDSEEAIAKRLAQAKVELAAADEFDLKIVNSDLDRAIAQLEAAIFKT